VKCNGRGEMQPVFLLGYRRFSLFRIKNTFLYNGKTVVGGKVSKIGLFTP